MIQSTPRERILVVDDDPQSLTSTQRILEHEGYSVEGASDGAQALERLREQGAPSIDAVVSDVRMPRLGGHGLLREVTGRFPVVLMTAFGTVEDAVEAMKLGAVDFLTKPFKRQGLVQALRGALVRSKRPPRSGGGRGAEEAPERALFGEADSMRKLRQLMASVGPTSVTVLIRGESGTGKERLARGLHLSGPRAHGPWVALNCAALPESLIESELFGHEKGAFTGAASSKGGLFEAADGGTLFLDEVGDMPPAVQAKLLRVLQEGEVRRVGAQETRKVDVRVIAASHQNLRELVGAGKFREDLLYRLEVVMLEIPPLRQRMEDLPGLAALLVEEHAREHGKPVAGLSEAALAALKAHQWPGNIRELSNALERAIVFSTGTLIELGDLPAHLGEHLVAEPEQEPVRVPVPPPFDAERLMTVKLGTPLREVEAELIRKTLEATDGDKNKTAKLLGVNPRTITRRIEGSP